MLPKKFRLQKREIEELKSLKNKIIQGRYFGLIYQKVSGEKKFALIISNRIVPKAVERNRIKRLFFKAVQNKFFDKEGKFLFLAKKSCLVANLEEFEKEMKEFRQNYV